ncbi:MAG: phosphatase PAP2 family protein [Anaerolineales bacterium]|jgi:membrane-associated phospholipid phosphatase
MNPLISFGISFITAFQSMGSWLEAPMKFFSFLGSENFFLIFLPLVYWSIDAALGIRVGFILLAGTGLNQLFKLAMHGPRPYWVSTNVRALASETGFGVPSGHAEMGAGLWGMIAAYYRKVWVWVAAVLLVFFIGLSRLYLGVHFPQDVLVGWVLGFLTLWAFVKFWEPVEARVKRMTFWNQIGLAFAVSLAMVLLGALIIFLSRDFVLPAEWIANATRNGIEAPNPFSFSMEALITSAATLFGLSSGLAWMAPRGGFNASGPLWKRAARYVVGLIGVMVFYAGLKVIFPSGDTLIPYIFRYIRYTFVGFWVSGGALWTFAKLNLTETDQIYAPPHTFP